SWASIIALKSTLDHHLDHTTRKYARWLSHFRAETWNGRTNCGMAYPLDACVMDSKRMTRASRSRKPCINRSSDVKVMAAGS
ncbi:hypothetical protein PIB30_075316, partial [Stylosanthes scabra]|nr:hypothetical protein [Stylosanthes scabra]